MSSDSANRWAQRRIEKARDSGVTELDLSVPKRSNVPKLTKIPKSLGLLTQLESLDLSNNQLISLPKSLENLTQLKFLNLSYNQFITLPDWLGNLVQLEMLSVANNQLLALPKSLCNLTQLKSLFIYGNRLTSFPSWISKLELLQELSFGQNSFENIPNFIPKFIDLKVLRIGTARGKSFPLKEVPIWVSRLTRLKLINLNGCDLSELPDWLPVLKELERVYSRNNNISELPISLVQLTNLKKIDLDENPLNPELAEAYKQGLDTVKIYLRAKAAAQITLNEAKLILVGEGEVGKTCLMDALLDKPWQEHPSTHGIEIQSFQVTDPSSQTLLTLNGWDFGGQRVYRPTHQLFFSAPAVYLVVWKPREGSQAGQVKEWIQLVKRREPSAKILVVATHGGPQQRQPDIDRQELWDLFGKETVVDFFFVDSKPDEHGHRKGIEELKRVIARVAATLPEVGRSVPKSFADVRAALQATGKPYLPLDEVLDLCRAHLLAMRRPGSSDYNLGNGEGYSVMQVIETAREITGHPLPVRREPRRPGDPPSLVGSAAKIRRELGWSPQTPDIRDILRSAWDWHRTHPHGYED